MQRSPERPRVGSVSHILSELPAASGPSRAFPDGVVWVEQAAVSRDGLLVQVRVTLVAVLDAAALRAAVRQRRENQKIWTRQRNEMREAELRGPTPIPETE